MKPSEALAKHREQILKIIDAHSVTNPRIFGSVSRGEDTDSSDLDILIDAGYEITYVDLFRLQEDLTSVLGVDVDLLTLEDLRLRVRARVLAESRQL